MDVYFTILVKQISQALEPIHLVIISQNYENQIKTKQMKVQLRKTSNVTHDRPNKLPSSTNLQFS